MIPVAVLIDYISKRYRGGRALSSTMLMYILFLIDWNYAKDKGTPLSDAEWRMTECGPVIADFSLILEAMTDLPKLYRESLLGEVGIYVLARPWMGRFYTGPLNKTVRSLIDAILNDVTQSNPNDFLDKVESTYPVLATNYDNDMNLQLLSDSYKRWLESAVEKDSTGSFNNLPSVKQ